MWKMNFFSRSGESREFCGWPGKFRKDLESQGILLINGFGSVKKICSVYWGKDVPYFIMR